MAVRAVIDTNIWISSLLNTTGFPARLRSSFENGAFQVIVSEPLFLEIANVLSRPRIKNKYDLTEDNIEELLSLIEERSDHVLLAHDIEICRDKNDNFVIETAIKGKAQYIVTRDDDIKGDPSVALFLKSYGISIQTVASFLSVIK